MTNRVNRLYEDSAGRLWAGTDDGLFRLEDDGGQKVFRRVEFDFPATKAPVFALLEDREGSLWIGASSGLTRLLPDGRSIRYVVYPSPKSNDSIRSLFEDADGRLWIGHRSKGLIVFKPQPAATAVSSDSLRWQTPDAQLPPGGKPLNFAAALPVTDGDARRFTVEDESETDMGVWVIRQSPNGRIWVLTHDDGLFLFKDGEVRLYASSRNMSFHQSVALTEDSDGNLWVGAKSGATKITRNGFTSYDATDGLGLSGAGGNANAKNIPYIQSIFENNNGELCVLNIEQESLVSINTFDGSRFSANRINYPKSIEYVGWGANQITFQDRAGEWWVTSGQGLLRFSKTGRVEELSRAEPRAVYTEQSGLTGNDVFRLYEDSRGDIWISTASATKAGLTRWERATETFHQFREINGEPLRGNAPTAFREDAAGNVWIGFYDGGLARYGGGRFTIYTVADGLPAGQIRALYLDRKNRLWMASALGGVARVDEPAAERPQFRRFTIAEGLTSDNTNCITEDLNGRIYVGTTRGVDRLDPATNRIKHYTSTDGLAGSEVRLAFRDRHGALWFGTMQGLSRLIPETEESQSPPSILINSLLIAGVPHPVSELGETEISNLELQPDQRQIQINFVSLGFDSCGVLRYQYKLEGADEDWSAPSLQRFVNYASLQPGKYRFLVRAVSSEAAVSPFPATISFAILPPIWQRGWFLALAAAVAALGIYALYRYRVAQLLKVERVRTRIAGDLHDDIGAGLSRIAILSEVACHQAEQQQHGDGQVREKLSVIAGVSRELVDSMSDIVWVINPNRDQLSDLTQRMRRFASDVFAARNIRFRFEVPEVDRDLKIGADVRRDLLLIFKECVNNIVRHSKCAEANIQLKTEGKWLVLRISDDGKGFDTSQTSDGNGLANIRLRAEKIGGEIRIVSNAESGTIISLKIPLAGEVRRRNNRLH